MGQGEGEGEGWSRSGARVADDSSVSSKCPNRILGDVDLEQKLSSNLDELKFTFKSRSSNTGEVLVNELNDWLKMPHPAMSRRWLVEQHQDAQENTKHFSRDTPCMQCMQS